MKNQFYAQCPGGTVTAETYNDLLAEFRKVNKKLKELCPDPVELTYDQMKDALGMLVARAKQFKGRGISPIIWNIAFSSIHKPLKQSSYETVLKHMNYRPEKYNQYLTELLEGPEVAMEMAREKDLENQSITA